jgi:hypothetical protein
MTPITAHTEPAFRAAMTQGWEQGKRLLAEGKPVAVLVAEHEDNRSLRANRFYWGVVLREISQQARICGQQYTADAFHELFKRQFLGFEIRKVKVAGRKKATVIRRLKSTTDLSVKRMAEYLERVQAFAVTDLGVQFSADDWQEWRE